VDIDTSLNFEPRDTSPSAAQLESALNGRRFSSSDAASLASRHNHVAEPRSTSALPSVPATLNLEPLQPARLRPAKEKTNSDSKRLESGEGANKQCAETADNGNNSECSTPSDSYQTPGGSPQREAPSLSERLTYDMSASSRAGPSCSYVVHGEAADSVQSGRDNGDLNKLQTSGSGKAVLQSALKSDGNVNDRTSFAKIRKWKERSSGSLESPVIYDQQGSPPKTMSKSVFVIHPAQTTWMEAACIQKSASDRQVCRSESELVDGGLAPGQMAGLKMKLEEKRRMIQSGKRRVEQQRSQQHQQVGEEAFVQMIRKGNRQPDRNVLPNNASQLTGSNVRSASTGRSPATGVSTGSHIMPKQQPSVSKDATVVRPSQGVVQPVLPGAVLPIAGVNSNVPNNRTVGGGASAVTRPTPSATQQADVVDNKSRPANAADKANQLEPPQGMSFDRLSTSLSDLQAEIVRLTQQQDEIKHLVSGGGGGANGGSSAGERAPFFLYPTTAQSVSTAPSAVQSASTAAVVPPTSLHQPPAYPPPTAYPVDPRLYVPEYGTFPPHYSSHHHHVASSLPHAAGLYPVSGVPPLTHRYPGGGPYMTPYPHDPMSGMYRSPGMPPTAASDVYPMHWPPGQAPQSFFMSSPYVDHSRHSVPGSALMSHATPSIPPHAVSMPGHSSREPAATGPVQSVSQPVQDVTTSKPTTFFVNTSSSFPEQIVSRPVTCTAEAPSVVSTTPTAATPMTQATAFFIDTSTISDASPVSHSSPPSKASPAPVPTPHATAFFVSTAPSVTSVTASASDESDLQYSSATDNVAVLEKDSDAKPSVTEEPSVLEPTDVQLPPPPAPPATSVDAKTPVVFVIGQDEEVC